jgi:hypothetical protein
MQNLVNEVPIKKNYDFIDVIRGIAMISIVAEHSISAGGFEFPYGSDKYWMNVVLIQLTKFGTISFFLLAGFLIGEKFADYSPAEYLKRRISTTFGPWLFWTFIYMIAMLITLRITEGIYHDNRFNLANILEQIKILYLHTSYWFIINFLVSISILLMFRRYLYSYYLGGSLLLFTLFYVVNVHFEWIDPRHTTAILGFVFFLWLGAQLRKHWEAVERKIRTTSYLTLFIFLIITFAFSVYEISSMQGKSIDPFNTLRISNILFSLVVFALLLRKRTFKFVNYLKPRRTTYGIYLIHYILLIFLLPELFGHLNIDVPNLSVPMSVLYRLCVFTVTYGLTFFLVLLISNSRFKKLVGN